MNSTHILAGRIADGVSVTYFDSGRQPEMRKFPSLEVPSVFDAFGLTVAQARDAADALENMQAPFPLHEIQRDAPAQSDHVLTR